MIKIRYRDPRELAPGLYAAAECHSRGTTVYLLPGLSAAQRRAALRRLRISARRGCGPCRYPYRSCRWWSKFRSRHSRGRPAG